MPRGLPQCLATPEMRPLPLKIAFVKTQIRRSNILYKQNKINHVIHFEQMDELYAKLHKLRIEEKKIAANVLESFCSANPSDAECRVYDI